MSGGSFNYLCFKDADEILGDALGWKEQVDYMIKALEDYKEFDNVAEFEVFLRSVINDMDQYENLRDRLDAKLEKYHSVMRAIEWHHSGDSGEEGVAKELSDLRSDK
jgi:hypothetical protein